MSARQVKVAPGGRIVIPGAFRKALGLSVGDDLVVEMTDGELRVRSLQAAVRRAQEVVRTYIPDPDRSLVDELIAERRAEAAREADE
jgi:AbrB family looped-hinge helix DNA binding protein